MTGIFSGVRIVEVAQWTFGPAAACVLADFGADVIKVEDPATGDPQRALVTSGITPMVGGINLVTEQTNRGKRSIGLNLKDPRGREILSRLIADADVFLTNMLPPARERLRITESDVRVDNPGIVYALATGYGAEGPYAGLGAYDATAYWARGGIAAALTDPDAAGGPPTQPPAFGDKAAAMNLAFGMAAALFRRERSGEPISVEVSLLGTALWQNSSAVVYSLGTGGEFPTQRRTITNPLAHSYQTADGRWLNLIMLQSDRYWPVLCKQVGRVDLAADERFADAERRREHSDACVAELAAVFRSRPLDYWRPLLDDVGPWAPFETMIETANSEQVRANGNVITVEYGDDIDVDLVSAPVRFDGQTPTLTRAPELAEHTEEVLLAVGFDWPEIIELKDSGVL